MATERWRPGKGERWVTDAKGRAEPGTVVLRATSPAYGYSHGKCSDMDPNKKSASWALPFKAGLAKFILGRNVKGTGRKPKADLVFLQHLPSKRQ